jgi:hypothetical protein
MRHAGAGVGCHGLMGRWVGWWGTGQALRTDNDEMKKEQHVRAAAAAAELAAVKVALAVLRSKSWVYTVLTH